MKYSNKVNKIVYGGDYNPEQWPKEVWKEDMKLLKEAHIDVLTLNVFAWASLQPSEEEYDFRVWMRLWNWLESMDLQSALQHLQRHIRHGWQKNIRISCG